jgi:hypothetical protein
LPFFTSAKYPCNPKTQDIMKTIRSFRSAFLHAAAALLLAASSGQSALVNSWTNGELIIGFRVAGGDGFGESYLVNIGNRTNYSTNTAPFTLSLGNLGLDLSGTYGTNWFSRTDLFWGVFGTTESVAPTLFASRAQPTNGVLSAPWPSEPDSAVRTITKSEIVSVTTEFNNLQSTANSTNAVFQTDAANAGSYNWQVTANSGTDFGSVSQWTSIEGLASQRLDLWQVSAATTYRGTFSLNSSGQISFLNDTPVGSAPVITSPTTATATIGVFFTYTITASNAPTSFNATGLPSGLSVNPTNGLIFGIPGVTTNASVNLSASNASGTGTAVLNLTILSAYAAWTGQYSLIGTNALAAADPDRDGFRNDLEFAFGTDPTRGNAALTGAARTGTNRLVTWLERPNGATYQVQGTTNLSTTWGAAPAGTNSTNTAGVPPGYTRKELNAATNTFYRVQALVTP